MANVVVVGAQWGDEGKGKIVDWLSVSADVVARYQGGHNAGHTLVIDGVTYKLSLLPSGIVRPGKLAVIGNGVVLDPRHLVKEIAGLRAKGVTVTRDNLRIAENAPLILSLHGDLDALRENSAAAGNKIGTTERGIGPAYEDKVGAPRHPGLDLAELSTIDAKIDRLLTHHNALRRGMGIEEIKPETIRAELEEVAPRILPFMDRTWSLLEDLRRQGKRILFEGAQGALLDIDHGTYPFVTSSNTVAARRAAGVGPRAQSGRLCAGHRQGLYDARRRRPVPDRAARRNRRARSASAAANSAPSPAAPRRCGWFDAVLVRQTVKTSGIDGIALTKLDILDGFDDAQGLRRLSARRRDHRLPAGLPVGAGAGRADLRDDRRLARADRRRAVLGATAGAGRQIRAPDRGIDSGAGRLALDKSRARGHNSDARSVPGLTPPRSHMDRDPASKAKARDG